MSDTLVVKVPVSGVPRALQPEVARILGELAPLVATQVGRKRRENLHALIEALASGVAIRTVDLRRARMQAKALQAILENSEWLTAAEVGKLGKFSQSNPAAPANRWKNEGKIFALEHEGQDRFPRYGLDETFRPLGVMEPVLEALGNISPWRIAGWFESTNARLANARPREVVAADPERVLQAARAYRSGAHG